MKTILLATAVLFGWAVYAHAGDGYSDPSDLRMPGVTVSSSAVTIKPADGGSNLCDPYGMKTPGVRADNTSVAMPNNDGPVESANSMPQPVDQSTLFAGHRTEPLVRGHISTTINAAPKG